MSIFSGNPEELEYALAYELTALQLLRTILFDESEKNNDLITVTLGDMNKNGDLRKHYHLEIDDDICGRAVEAALSQFQPLAFGAAFKMQDMIAEWILRENGCTGKGDWRFQAKLQNYDRLSKSESLTEPCFFSSRPFLSKAFWELFRRFEPYRGTLTHAGGVSILRNGTLRIIKPGLAPLELSNSEQSAYIQAVCIISNELISRTAANAYLEAVIESAMAKLINYHGISELKNRPIKLSRLKVIVPPSQLASNNPLSVEVNWDLLRETMRKTYGIDGKTCFPIMNKGKIELMQGGAGEVFFPVTIEILGNESVTRWDLPLEVVPTGVVTLTEGDPKFDNYLVRYPGSDL